jgi:N-acetyl-beta-hexosaminidase
MSNNTQKFESSMFEYCSAQAERAYKLIEDNDVENGMQFLAHLADVLQFLVEARTTQGTTHIGEFAKNLKVLEELEKDQVYTHLQENGFGQYISE